MHLFWILTGIFAITTVHGNIDDKDMYKDLYYNEEMPHDSEEAQDYSDYGGHNDDKMIEKEIERLSQENAKLLDNDNDEENIDDYQIEDNRSEVKDDYADGMELESVEGEDEGDQVVEDNQEDDANNKDGSIEQPKEPSVEVEDVKNDMSNNEPSAKDAQRKILEETSALLNEDNNNDYDDEFGVLNKIEDSNIDQAVEETERLLKEDTDNDFALDKSVNADDVENDKEQILEEGFDEEEKDNAEETNLDDVDKDVDDDSKMVEDEVDSGEDTVDKAYSDLIDDLTKLRETWNKLKDEVDEADMKEEDLPGFEEIKNKLFEMEHAAPEDYEEIDDKNLSKLFEEHPDKSNEDIEDNEDIEEGEEKEYEDVADDEVVKEETEKKSTERTPTEVTESTKLIHYVDDALVANEQTESNINVETTKKPVKIHNVEPLVFGNEDVETTIKLNDETTETKTKELDVGSKDTDSSEFNGIIYPGQGSTIIDANSNHPLVIDEQNTKAPLRIKLSLDEPVILTSPNYPDPYPENSVFDWILEGEGSGIEFNVTDFSLNGNVGDFLLVKPGRENSTGEDGLVYTHELNAQRNFRFLDVNKVFVRFRTMPATRLKRGFKLSFQLIAPVPEIDTDGPMEPTPDPSTIPDYRMTVNLGLSLANFSQVEEEFRLVIADMATMYIHENNIEPGLNSTRDVAVIKSIGLCFLNWPRSDACSVVSFGVPLRYKMSDELDYRLNDEDLYKMWYEYSVRDPFATRLAQLGIWEFEVPDDNNVLMVWLVIAAGVVISMAMLAFALWRFSCFEEYTKMPAFSDTESVNEKKTLDLYPTPHQTLPPLYAEAEYKWGDAKYEEATRVDMGGFTNRSYARTEEYDFESDEEVVPARDRYTTDV